MKKAYFLSVIFLLQFCAFGQNIVFADANFKAKLLESSPSNYIASDINNHYIAIDSNSDNEIQYSEALAVNWLGVISTAVTDISGIENFTNLHGLSLGTPNITALPISALTQLTDISLDLNAPISLTAVENHYLLEWLQLVGAGITAIDLQNLHGLKYFSCYNTSLTDINFCGTIVNFAHFESNLLLESVNFKNNVISTVFGRSVANGPPPLPNIIFENCPAINHICYDEGEYDAVSNTLFSQLGNITFTTGCDSNCTLATAAFDGNNEIALLPNPAADFITIESKNTNLNSVILFNALGQLVKTVPNASGNSSMTMNIAELKSGIYFLTINSGNGETTKRFIKL